jgi:hypothetical protein
MRMLGLLMAAFIVPGIASAQTGKHVAVGGGIIGVKYVESDFSQSNPSFSFEYRVRPNPDSKDGWSWTARGGFGWFTADTNRDIAGLPTALGELRARPIMAGIERSYVRGPLSVGFAAVAGPSFNNFSTTDAARAAYLARLGTELRDVSVKTSFAVRPEVGVWYDLGPWLALHASVDYMLNRITAETTAGSVQSSTTWKTDHVGARIGLVVGIF